MVFLDNASQDAFAAKTRGNIPIAANITFLEDSLGHYNKTSNISISRFLIKVCLD